MNNLLSWLEVDGVLLIAVGLVLLFGIFVIYFLGYGRSAVQIYPLKVLKGDAEPSLTASERSKKRVVFLSSDMGPFLGLGSKLICAMNQSGAEVIALNSLKFFMKPKTSKQIALKIGELIEEIASGYPVMLVAQSFGADAFLMAASELSERHRALISRVVLIVPSQQGYFRATPAEILNRAPASIDLSSGAAALDFAPVFAIGARDDPKSLHHLSAASSFGWEVLAGGHFLNHAHASVVALLTQWITQELPIKSTESGKITPIR